MIIRETRVIECWCDHCHKGQMKDIFEKSFEEKKHISEYVGLKFNCEVCGFENKIEDYLIVIPHQFMTTE
jgi:uncharacterized protein (DUF983 family)